MADYFHIENDILTLYDGREESITVPEGVRTIGEGAFKSCVSLKKILLPQSLRTIMPRAFKGCRKLEEIHIPSGVCQIGDYAFHRCHSLRQITLPPSVEELGDCVFLYCDSLTRIVMPGVRRLGKQAFVNDVLLKELVISRKLEEDCICDVFTSCGSISSIAFPDGETFTFPNTVEVVAGEMKVPSLVRVIAVDVLRMMDLDGRRLVKFLTNLKHVEIPEGIQSIGKSCFFDKRGILSVQLPSSLKEIESRAFRNCISLETVTFKNQAVSIHKDAFKNCTSLKHVAVEDGTVYTFQGISSLSDKEIPPLVQTIHRQVIGNFLISGTILLKYLGSESRVVVPEGITIIAEEAFAGNEAVDRVILPHSLIEIGAAAFRDCLLLQTIEFPEQVSRIGAEAFENCVKLIRAVLPPMLTQVERCTFKHCHVLREIFFDSRVTAIGEQAFYKCISLKEVVFPHSLTAIGEMAFYRCSNLKEIRLPQAVTQVGNLAFSESGVKKVRICGDGMDFGTDIFSRCPRLKTLVLEEGVLHIPDKLTFGCAALNQVVIPSSLQSVGRHALEKTPFLESLLEKCLSFSEHDGILWDGRNLSSVVNLPETVKIVAGGAFYGNTALTHIHFPDTVTWIGSAALKGCENLSAVSWPSTIEEIQDEVFSGCSKLETLDTHGIFRRVGKRAFFRCVKFRCLPMEYMETLGKEAFFGCEALELGNLPALVHVGERAFEHTLFGGVVNHILLSLLETKEEFEKRSCCINGHSGENCVFGEIGTSEKIRSPGEIHIPEGIRSIAPYAFAGRQDITAVKFPSTLSFIGEGAFWGCSALETVVFPDNLCHIDSRAFEKCVSLKSVNIQTEHVGDRAFAFCTSLSEAELHGLIVLGKRLFEGCKNLRTCVCPQAETIEDWCFCGCEHLEYFDFSSISYVGTYGFQDCDSLNVLNLKDGICLMPHAFEDCGRLKEILLSGVEGTACVREYAFSGCTSLKTIIWHGKPCKLETYQDILSDQLPEIVRLIYHSALSCFLVEKESILLGYRGQGRIVKIPKGIRQIQAEAFRDILMIREIEIPETVEYIGARAFHGTAWLENQRRISPLVIVNDMLLDGSCCKGQVTVPPHVRLVCGWAFANGMGIRRIHFSSNRVKVEEYAFRNCIYLEEMELADGSVIQFHGIADRKRHLPPVAMQAIMDSLNCFKTDDHNVLVECTGNISDLLVADGITAIGDSVFQDGNLLSRIRLPHSVTSIGKSAFFGCKWLTVVEHADGVEHIGAMAFAGCGRLERIELSHNLRFIGTRAFENCTSLKEIVIPEGVVEIPDRAFFRCHSLEKVQLPSSLKRIGREAFAFCKNLSLPSIGSEVEVGERAFTGLPCKERR